MLQPVNWTYSKGASFAQGVEVGDTIYVAGQAALDDQGKVVGLGDMRAQSRQTFANIATVLAEAGSTMDDVVKSFATSQTRANTASTHRYAKRSSPGICPRARQWSFLRW